MQNTTGQMPAMQGEVGYVLVFSMLQVLSACMPVFIWSPVNFGAVGGSILDHFGGVGGLISAYFEGGSVTRS